MDLIEHSEWSRERIELIKQIYCKDGSDLDLQLFISTCKRLHLSPEAKQIYAVIRKTKDGSKMSIQTSIDGYRLIADRTDKYEGQTSAEWCGKSGEWMPMWLSDELPLASRIGVFKRGFREPIYGIAHWREYAQTSYDGKPTQFWAKMPRLMLSKVAEALALRKAFPNELSGIYMDDEMPQINSQPTPLKRNEIPIESLEAFSAEKRAFLHHELEFELLEK